jgi:hypothetical protein
MRLTATRIIVLAVLGVGVAAGVDALAGAGEPARAPANAARSPALAAKLRGEGLAGVITYSDRRCRLHAIRLPSLRPANAPRIESCEPHIPTGGLGAWKGDVVWSGFGFGTVQVVLSKRELTRALRGHGREAVGGYRAHQAVPLAGGRYAVLVAAHAAPWERLLVFLAGKQPHSLVTAFVGENDVLRPSPLGGYVAVLDPGRAGIRVFRRDGRSLLLPPVTNPHAVAWSPDERWTALATRWSVYIFPTARPRGPLLRIPLAVRDLDWDK